MGWKNWKVDMTLLQYKGEWYRTTDDINQGMSITQHFDIVVEVKDNEFNILKNRHGAIGDGAFSDLFRMQLFAIGKTLEDLPEFTKSSRYHNEIVFGYKDNGDLFEYSEPTRTAQ